MNELELVKTVVHRYLIATLTYSTLSYDLQSIKRSVKVSGPYEKVIIRSLKILDGEIKNLRIEMNALKISGNIPSSDVDEYFVEYVIAAKGEEHKVQYARAALRNHVTTKINELFDS